jgi:hypothetical protein
LDGDMVRYQADNGANGWVWASQLVKPDGPAKVARVLGFAPDGEGYRMLLVARDELLDRQIIFD